MAILKNNITALNAHFFLPLTSIFTTLKSARSCPKLSDEDWVHMGIHRVLHGLKSGRDFLQSLRAKLHLPTVAHFFDTLKSSRRLALCQEANARLLQTIHQNVPDVFAAYSCLDSFDLYASDGHSHAAAVHDAQQYSRSSATKKAKFGTNHIYSLNLRNHGLHHLIKADQVTRRKEHEMRSLKRLTLAQLRLGASKGKKVLHVYDPACIDYELWRQLKTGGVYFLTRPKSNTSMMQSGARPIEHTDTLDAGVVFDRNVGVSQTMMRHIRYQCPMSGETFDFLTNEMTIPPGLIARIYQMRWDIEKVYDQMKNKFQEQKAWASSPAAKNMQAQFICLTHNLMVLQEHRLRVEENITNTSEIKRKAKRLAKERAKLADKKQVLPALLEDFQRLTQRSVKYIRWLRAYLFDPAPWKAVVDELRQSYAHF